MKFKYLNLELAIFILISYGSSNLNANVQSLAVLPFENAMSDSALDWLSIGIPETITNDLQAIKGVTLIERLQLRKVMDEQKLQLTGLIDDKTVVKVGKIIGADIVVVGAFQKQDDSIRLTARFVDVQTAGIIQTAKVTGKMSDIFDLQDEIVKELMRNLNIELKQAELEKLAEKPTGSLVAYQHFGQGALLQAKKDYKGATEELGQALKADPNYTAAKEKFKEAFWSLNKNNYWTWETKTETEIEMPGRGASINNTSSGSITRRAGGIGDFKGVSAFSYFPEYSGEYAVKTSLGTSLNGATKSKSTEYYSKKDDGVYLLGIEEELSGKDPGSSRNSTLVNDPPVLAFPFEMAVGKKWSTSYVSKGEYNTVQKSPNSSHVDSMHMDNQVNVSNEVIQKDTVTVPAGTFDCFVIKTVEVRNPGSTSGRQPSATSTETLWFSSGIGIIKTETEKYSDNIRLGTSKSKTVRVLKEYHIEE